MPRQMRSFSTSTSSTMRLDALALAVKRERVLARDAPGDVGHVDHAVDVAVEADEQAELGGVLDFALDGRADRVLVGEGLPRIGLRLLEAERDAALLLVDLEHHHVDFLLVETILPGWTFFLVQLISETWTRPSMPGSSSTNAPYSVMLVTRPLNSPPTGYLAAAPSHGSLSSCFMPRLMRCVSRLMRMICTFTVSPMPSTSLGWLTRL